MTKKDALKRVKAIISESMDKQGEAIIVTAGEDGLPHAAWMGTLNSPDIATILTMTSPDSRKVINILQNPKVEWMFTSRKREEVAYLRGEARIIHELNEIESSWKKMKDKTRAYFMQYMTKPGMKFLVIETKVSEVEYLVPQENILKTMKPPFHG